MIDAAFPIELPASPGEPGASSCIVGPENELLAPALVRLLAPEPLPAAAEGFNPLVLTGPSGAGKTLVAQAAARHFARCYGVERAHYFTAADFCRELHEAGADGRSGEWLARLRRTALLVVEGLDRLRPRHPAQWELRALVDAIVAAGGCVVATARQPLACLPQLEPGLRDRLAAGLTIGLNWPGESARRAILAGEAARRGLRLPAETLDLLARKHDGPATKALGALARLDATPVARLADDGESHALFAAGAPSLKQIVAVACRYFRITQTALASPSRRKSLVHARCVVAYLARRLTECSYAEIGRALGGRDHTTIIHAESRIQDLLVHDAATAEAIDHLGRILQSA
ncbi:MAG: ATP-binding protein [Pirellulales bacterium]|nr:ATP-binding protein [Pirellulales bacterium]